MLDATVDREAKNDDDDDEILFSDSDKDKKCSAVNRATK